MKRRVIEATFDVMIEDGYAALTITRVADRAGVSNGTPLHHFGSRDAMLEAAARTAANNIVRMTIQMMRDARISGDSLETLVLRLWREILLQREGRVLAEFMDYSRHAPRQAEAMESLWTRLYRLTQRLDLSKYQRFTGPTPPARFLILVQWLMRGMALDVHLGAPEELFESYIKLWIRSLTEE